MLLVTSLLSCIADPLGHSCLTHPDGLTDLGGSETDLACFERQKRPPLSRFADVELCALQLLQQLLGTRFVADDLSGLACTPWGQGSGHLYVPIVDFSVRTGLARNAGA
jgi:hypothetical protein